GPERAWDGVMTQGDLIHGQKTGMFLEQRLNRRRAEARARGKRVLDLFCYQGEWTLHALRGSAASALAVDSSADALAAARRNFERQGCQEAVRTRRGDCFDVLRDLAAARERFGPVLLHP